MLWTKGPDKNDPPKDEAQKAPLSPQEPFSGQPGAKPDAAFDPGRLPEPKKLSRDMKSIVEKADQTDMEDSFYEDFVEGYGPESTETNLRYAAYTTRIRTVLSSAHRYVAYTSDIGESFRPVAHSNLVRSAYGISWLYILGDVSYEGYKSYLHNERTRNPAKELTERQSKITGLEEKPAPHEVVKKGEEVSPLEDYRTVMVQRAIFQSIASMGLPAFTIHSIVKYSGRAMKDMKSKRIRTWGPIGLGLAIVPFLPSLYDHPVENAVEWVFHKGFEAYGGKSYVGDTPMIGREKELTQRPGHGKEKEL
ncbi:hypothetical protein MKZ38_003167 [Zalerion maritima]|uniref:Mitochondrial fission process protein 1 n=1 Tax=Zalerion maritima TaxID=339359 RepID=A0AAD5RZ80_9PEZI|nr:hypothetical protein MKZ38_003167 [Zalerion maritima]